MLFFRKYLKQVVACGRVFCSTVVEYQIVGSWVQFLVGGGGGSRGGGSFFLFVSILIMKGITTLFNVMILDLH